MSRLPVFLFAIVASALIPAVALADTPVATLQPGARVEYRFDYLGDGSAIKAVLSETDPNSLVMSMYGADQIDAVRRNESPTPIGRGTLLRGEVGLPVG